MLTRLPQHIKKGIEETFFILNKAVGMSSEEWRKREKKILKICLSPLICLRSSAWFYLSLSLVEEGRNNAVVVLLLLYFERHFFPLFPFFFGGKYIKIVVYRCNINSCVYDFSHLSGGSPDNYRPIAGNLEAKEKTIVNTYCHTRRPRFLI